MRSNKDEGWGHMGAERMLAWVQEQPPKELNGCQCLQGDSQALHQYQRWHSQQCARTPLVTAAQQSKRHITLSVCIRSGKA